MGMFGRDLDRSSCVGGVRTRKKQLSIRNSGVGKTWSINASVLKRCFFLHRCVYGRKKVENLQTFIVRNRADLSAAFPWR
jgi:hypothetical protein